MLQLVAYIVSAVLYIQSQFVCVRSILQPTKRHASCRRLATRRFKCINRRIVLVVKT